MSDTPSVSNESAENNAAETPLSPGAQLKARRQELGWSVEEVASYMNLAPRQVRALEADNFDALPVLAITRGFMRSYAKLLGLDPEPLLAAIPSIHAPETAQIAPKRRLGPGGIPVNRHSDIVWKRRSSYRVLFILVPVLLLLIALAYTVDWRVMLEQWQQPGADAGAGQQSTAADALSTPGVVTSVIPAPGLADVDATAPNTNPNPDASNNPDANSGPNPGTNGNTTLSMPQLLTEAQAGPAPLNAAASAASSDVLVLSVREDAWIEIRRADRSVLISRVVKAGQTESFPVDGPLSLVIGNAQGVEARLRGEVLTLVVKNNIVRMTVN